MPLDACDHMGHRWDRPSRPTCSTDLANEYSWASSVVKRFNTGQRHRRAQKVVLGCKVIHAIRVDHFLEQHMDPTFRCLIAWIQPADRFVGLAVYLRQAPLCRDSGKREGAKRRDREERGEAEGGQVQRTRDERRRKGKMMEGQEKGKRSAVLFGKASAGSVVQE